MVKRQMTAANTKASEQRQRLEAMTKERDELKAQLSKNAAPSSEGPQLKALQSEKAALEKSLAEAKAAAARVDQLNATIVRF